MSRTGPTAIDRWTLAFWGCLAGFIVHQLAVVATADYGIFPDEAYYLDWSHRLDWGYFSKPHLLAWLLRAQAMLCGEGPVCLRGVPVLAYAAAGALSFLTVRKWASSPAAFATGAIFLTLPFVAYLSRIVSTDALLLTFWSAGLYALTAIVQGPARLGSWLVLGVVVGLGIMSKYTMGIFLLGMVFLFVWDRDARTALRGSGPWWALGLAAALWAPNLVWNSHHEFITFGHLRELSHIERQIDPRTGFGHFLLGQVLVAGPVALLGFAMALVALPVAERRVRFFVSFALPSLALMGAQSLVGNTHANWAITSYLGACALVGLWLTRRGRYQALGLMLALQVLAAGAITHFDTVVAAIGVPVEGKYDIYARMRGWRSLAERVRPRLGQDQSLGLMSDDRMVLAAMRYYLPAWDRPAARLNPSGGIHNQYDMRGYDPEGRYLLVARHADLASVRRYFREVRPLETVSISSRYAELHRYRLYFVRGWRGWPLPRAGEGAHWNTKW